jgi:epoxyqueuosine reductase QueG
MAPHTTSVRNGSDTAWIVERASALGFDLCGVVRAKKFPELNPTQEWLARGYAGEMKYLADERRSDPQRVMTGLRSVIVCALNYNSPEPRSVDALMPDTPGDRTTTKSSGRSSKAWRVASLNGSPNHMKHASTLTLVLYTSASLLNTPA